MPAVAELDGPQTFAAFEGRVSGNVIKGVSLIHEGPALGHTHQGFQIVVDDKAMREFERIAKEQKRIKVKFNHGGVVQDAVGYVENFRRRGKKLLGDVTVLNAHPSRELLLEMVETISDAFGISLVFQYGEYDWLDNQEAFAVRPEQILSADFVDSPAANPTGLFEQRIDNTNEDMANDAIEQVRAEFAAKEAELIAKITDLESKVEGFSRAAGIIEETITVTPAPEPQADPFAKFDAKFAELETLLKTFAAAPVTNQPAAPVNEPEAAPEPPKSYADARKEAIGNATGLARLTAIRKFEEKHPSEAAYIASFKK